MKTHLSSRNLFILGSILVVLVLAGAAINRLRSVPDAAPAAFPGEMWARGALEDAGFSSAKMAEGLAAIRARSVPVHSLLLVRHGKLILDANFYPYDPALYHDVASVTKSVMTTLIGIAADQGKLDLDATMLSFFPGREVANRDERKERITVRHLLSMSSGLDCTEEGDERTQREMRSSPDYVQFVLDRKAAWEPGTHWVYCSPGMHMLSAILQQATGETALEFARANLFGPLGIQDVYWPADPQGVTHGWGDLALHPQDMARIGYLILNNGRWGEKQVVSEKWLEQALQSRFETNRGEGYGYGWWISGPDEDIPFVLASGNSGQHIQVLDSLDLIIVTTGSASFSYDEIVPEIVAAIGDLEEPLPADPDGQARLQAQLAALQEPFSMTAVQPIPDAARAIAGQSFTCAENPFGLQSVQLAFDAEDEARLELGVAGEGEVRQMVVGLDGVYRPSRAGRPIVARGVWEGQDTLLIEVSEGPGQGKYFVEVKIDGEDQPFLCRSAGGEVLGLRIKF